MIDGLLEYRTIQAFGSFTKCLIELADDVRWHGLRNLFIRCTRLSNANRTCRWQTTPFLGIYSLFLQMYDTCFRQPLQVVQYPSIGNIQRLRNLCDRLPCSKDFKDAPTKRIGKDVRTIIFDNKHRVF